MSRIAVVGAGIVGICCALELQRRGHRVLLLDRSGPATETSYGNAGVICDCGIHPLADPALIPAIPRLITNRDSRFHVEYAELPRLAPWLSRVAMNMNRRTFDRNTTRVAGLAADAVARHRQLMAASGCQQMLNDTGWLKLYRHPGDFRGVPALAHSFHDHGVACEIVDAAQIRDLEPDLSLDYAGGLWMNRTPTLRNPAALAKAYFALFSGSGGEFRIGAVRALTPQPRGWQLAMEDGTEDTDAILVTAGAWCNALLAPLGITLPFIQERGYHMMFDAQPGRVLNRSIIDTAAGFVMTPMEHGLRVTTGANITARERKPNPVQLHKLMPLIRRTFPLAQALLEQPWMGRRTSTADSLPLIGPVANRPGLFVATGHGHLGLTLAPVTAALVADEIDHRPDSRCRPFHPGRH